MCVIFCIYICVCRQAYICTYIHITYMPAFIHVYIHRYTCIKADMNGHMCVLVHKYVYYKPTYMNVYI